MNGKENGEDIQFSSEGILHLNGPFYHSVPLQISHSFYSKCMDILNVDCAQVSYYDVTANCCDNKIENSLYLHCKWEMRVYILVAYVRCMRCTKGKITILIMSHSQLRSTQSKSDPPQYRYKIEYRIFSTHQTIYTLQLKRWYRLRCGSSSNGGVDPGTSMYLSYIANESRMDSNSDSSLK